MIIDTACTQVRAIPGLIISTFFVSYLKIPQISTKIVLSSEAHVGATMIHEVSNRNGKILDVKDWA